MKLLADENVHAAIVAWLRSCGHDVVWAAEDYSSLGDGALLNIANASSRVVLTRDKDFGFLVFREHRSAHGVILLRLEAQNQFERLSVLKAMWSEVEPQALNNFVVVTNERVRVRSLRPFG